MSAFAFSMRSYSASVGCYVDDGAAAGSVVVSHKMADCANMCDRNILNCSETLSLIYHCLRRLQ